MHGSAMRKTMSAVIATALLGAVAFVHLKNGFWAHSNPSGYEYALVLLVVSLAVAMIGGGALALKR